MMMYVFVNIVTARMQETLKNLDILELVTMLPIIEEALKDSDE